MEGVLVHTTLNGEKTLNKILKTGQIGLNSEAISKQPPIFENKPLVFCSYVSQEYPKIYTGQGIVFETELPVVYACPTDNFEFMRSGMWLPGYEKFFFPSLKAMLEKYPSPIDFQRDFQKYFAQLGPKKVYPQEEEREAELRYNGDYCLMSKWEPGCNEIAFQKPLKIKNPKIFNSREELEKIAFI